MNYKSTHTGAQIDAGVSAALNPDATPTLSSTNLVTSGGVAAKLSEKQDTLVFDNEPTSGSNNPVKSSGIYSALAGKQATLTFDDVPTDGSNNPVKSGGIYDALALKADKTDVATADAALTQMILASFPVDTVTDAAIASITDGAEGIPVKALTVNITPVQAAGTPTPESPLPISGWTGANITVIGKNLFDVDNAAVYSRSINDNTLKYVPASSSKSYAVPCLPNTTYAVSCDNPNITIFRICYIKDISIPDSGSLDAYGIQTATASGSFTITTGADATYLIVQINSAVIAESAGKVQIEFGSAATEYAPYNSASAVHSVSWQSEAGTVYGGTLTDNGDGTWTLKARPYYSSYAGETLVGPWVSSMDEYAAGTTPTTGAQVVDLGGAETAATLTAADIETLLGANNIFADCGDIAELTYRADVGLYIAKKLAEA